MFTFDKNQCSRCLRIGVHDGCEYAAYKNSVLLLATTKDGINFDIRRIIQEDSVISAAYKHLSKTVSEASIRQMVIEDAKVQADDESESEDDAE